MPDHIVNRGRIVQALREELVGPAPHGPEVDTAVPVVIRTVEESYGPRVQKGSGEEIILRERPIIRYGVGVLFPMQPQSPEMDLQESQAEPDASDDPESRMLAMLASEGADATEDAALSRLDMLSPEARHTLESADERQAPDDGADDPAEFDLSSANVANPSSMGISFLVRLLPGSILHIDASGGRYDPRDVRIAGKTHRWWLRRPVTIAAVVRASDLCSTSTGRVLPRSTDIQATNTEGMDINLEVYSRPWGDPSDCVRLLTVCLINRAVGTHSKDELCLFQSHFKARVSDASGQVGEHVLPYPVVHGHALDDEEQSIALLYRRATTFAIGHGCAADWWARPGARCPGQVSAECMPVTETPSITPDIRRPNGSPVEISMAVLAGLVQGSDGMADLEELITLYENWIAKRREEVPALPSAVQAAASRHLAECAGCALRMAEGLRYLRTNAQALRAFRLANHAMLLQQICGRQPTRYIQEYNPKVGRDEFTSPYVKPDPSKPSDGIGKWRAFQMGFLLMGLRSSGDGTAPDRETVELIWFPTGGGKTEAYLALSAFSIFMRRLRDPQDTGVQVLMRYTLRLLTAQQFQRAAGLICAMDYLRKGLRSELGEGEFSIGIWLGSATTPNTREDAVKTLGELMKGSRQTENRLVVARCPWCGAQIGPRDKATSGKAAKGQNPVPGYVRSGFTVAFKCPDAACEFRNGMPVYVIDEDIYEKRPSMVIGTVDKFAMLGWRPEARALFGLDENGDRKYSPPGLILQDELHLISGPLGSIVGLYESVIEELCTDRRGGKRVKPKVVSSTATIRRYQEQVKALFARDSVVLFPPPGLDAGDSFFARYAQDEQGNLQPGRMYVGVHAPALKTLQMAQVRAMSALLQAPESLTPEERDPWWTMLVFHNSLRELGGTRSLIQSYVGVYTKSLLNRTGKTIEHARRLWDVRELTGRLRSDEVPKALAALQIPCTDTLKRPIDICLASNIMEVGVDIDRLSLMVVVAQPKATSQYIQVTGRIGRRWWERPGLVVTLYSATRPRDRSHFERFRSYHQQLYAQVEPTSVTPFSPPALERALHAIMVVYARQAGDRALAKSPLPYPEEAMKELRALLEERVRKVDPEELETLRAMFERRTGEWKRWQRRGWKAAPKDSEVGLLREAGVFTDSMAAQISWAMPMSMRDVDAECDADISEAYLRDLPFPASDQTQDAPEQEVEREVIPSA